MSWLFSRALVEEYSEGICLDGDASVQLNVMPTQHKFWRNDKTMEFSRLSQFGLTLRLLTERDGEALLTLFLAGFPAKTLVVQEKAQESTESEADYGATWQGSLARYDQDSHSLKTAQCSLIEDLTGCCVTLPRWGSMRNGALYQRQMLAQFIYESAPGLSLPTPRSCSAIAAQITNKTAGAKFPNLETVIARLTLPTLGANDGKGASKSRYIGSPDFRGAKMSKGLRTCENDPIYLNPQFAELTMMWPLGWTDLKPLETARFLEWQQQHSLNYQDKGAA